MGLYPNENDANYGYIPFGGGQRKCVGDQFAMQEAVVILSKLFQRFDIELAGAFFPPASYISEPPLPLASRCSFPFSSLLSC